MEPPVTSPSVMAGTGSCSSNSSNEDNDGRKQQQQQQHHQHVRPHDDHHHHHHNPRPKSLSGGCACGAVTYTSHAPAQHLDFCYCGACQRVSGAPVVAWAGIARGALVWRGLAVAHHVRLSDFATRRFCSRCGGTLALQYDCYPGKTHVAAATVARSDWGLPPPGVHIFVRSRPAWFPVPGDTTGVPQYDEFDEAFPLVLQRYRESLARCLTPIVRSPVVSSGSRNFC